MCRGKDCSGRRCPGDTSDARRARRYASAASSRSGTLTASSVRSAPPPAPAVDERPEVEKLTEEAESLRSAIRSCEQIGRQSTEMLSGLRNVYRGDGDKALSEFTRLLGEKLEAEGVDPRFYGPGEGHLFDTETGNFRWTVAEQKVVELGARTDAWLDGELLDDAQAVADAQDAESAAEAAHKAVDDEIRGVWESHIARFLKPEMGEDEIEEVRRHNAERDELMKPLLKRRDETYDEMYSARVATRAAKDAYYVRKRELLGQIRPMGGDVKWEDGGVKTSKSVGEEIAKAASMLPSDWIEMSNAAERGDTSIWRHQGYGLKAMRVRESSKRSHYSSHKFVTKREVFPLRHASSFMGKTREEYAAEMASDPRKKIIPREQWTDSEVENASYDGLVYEECDVAYPGRSFRADYDFFGPKRKTKLDGRILVDEEGNLTLTGAAARGWEKHEYTDRYGDEQVCWRRTRTRVELTKEAGLAELTFPKGSEGSSVTLHEMTHRCEDANRTIGMLEARFLLRRTTDENGERHEDEPYYNTEEHKKERVRPDSFVDRYIGKDYGSATFHEVMSVGNEIALFGRMGGFGKVNNDGAHLDKGNVRDDDHHAFVLGTLLSA